jgi:hypothetical protein
MLSPQLAALLQIWWREGKRRNVMLPAPGARRSGRYCGFDANTARMVVSTRGLMLVTIAPNGPGWGASTESATRGRQVKGKGRTSEMSR